MKWPGVMTVMKEEVPISLMTNRVMGAARMSLAAPGCAGSTENGGKDPDSDARVIAIACEEEQDICKTSFKEEVKANAGTEQVARPPSRRSPMKIGWM